MYLSYQIEPDSSPDTAPLRKIFQMTECDWKGLIGQGNQALKEKAAKIYIKTSILSVQVGYLFYDSNIPGILAKKSFPVIDRASALTKYWKESDILPEWPYSAIPPLAE